MHLLMIVVSLILAYSVRRLASTRVEQEHSFFYFLFPPLLLLMTALAIVSMGPKGEMLGLKASWLSYLIAWTYLVMITALLIKLSYQAWRQTQTIAKYPQALVLNHQAHVIETDLPYCAQIGFWDSQLVVSRGLLKLLNPEELEAVFAHEQAHKTYNDNFWFFWLGWLRGSTAWIPHTEALWQELLIFRELRADHWAAQQLNGLVVAQALLKVAQGVNQHLLEQPNLSFSVELSDGNLGRLEQRIEALLYDTQPPQDFNWSWTGIMASLIPVMTIFLHN